MAGAGGVAGFRRFSDRPPGREWLLPTGRRHHRLQHPEGTMTSSATVAEAPEGLRSATEVVSCFIDVMARRMAKVVGFSWVATPKAPSIYPDLRAAYEESRQSGSPLPVSSL